VFERLPAAVAKRENIGEDADRQETREGGQVWATMIVQKRRHTGQISLEHGFFWGPSNTV